jgi:alpha-tubulin suppressor-like RCC1 family protein
VIEDDRPIQLPPNPLLDYPISLKERIKQVACGATHTAILTDTGDIYSIGCLYGIVHKTPTKVETRYVCMYLDLAGPCDSIRFNSCLFGV